MSVPDSRLTPRQLARARSVLVSLCPWWAACSPRAYRLHSQGVEAVQRYLAQVWGEAAARFRLLAENTR
jgi:hypothetical protein